MSRPIIEVEKLSKRYRLGKFNAQTIREEVEQLIARFRNRATTRGRKLAGETAEFWALENVSFSVQPGEVLGIIGRNGAGKSTLLKILSRITEPTSGFARIRGRVGSLLEVGTGFHPELTGRENIFLNGAILGMRRAEVKAKFDEIVAFAEVDRFIDTPVKRYSSGMYVRLAFAVAAHLEPDILVVDEVLAVGDAEFQRKCLGRMGEIAKDGRTVLFVSHNMTAIRELCVKSLWLQDGKVRKAGLINEIVYAYLRDVRASASTGVFSASQTKSDGRVELLSYRVTNAAGEDNPPPGTKEDVVIHVKLKINRKIAQAAYGISIINQFGVLMTCINTVEQGLVPAPLQAGEATISIKIKNIVFLPGIYTASVWVMNPQCHIYAMAENSIVFEIAQAPIYGTSHVDHRWGCVFSDIRFTVSADSVPSKAYVN